MDNIEYYSKVNNLIALCHLVDRYDKFKSLNEVIEKMKNLNFVVGLDKISRGKRCVFSLKTRRIYQEYREIIDIINEYSNLINFVSSYYDVWDNKVYSNRDFIFFVEYIYEHKEEKNKIIALLNKIKKLGFDSIIFNEKFNFSEEIFEVNEYFNENRNFIYLDNIQIIPGYNDGIIRYKTTGSNYKMKLNNFLLLNSISICFSNIVLNDLTFDYYNLPSSLSKEDTFVKIIKLKKEYKSEFDLISDFVKISIGVDDLYTLFIRVNSVVNNVEHFSKKGELKEVLVNIRDLILELQDICVREKLLVCESSKDITEPLLSEIKERKRRRNFY